MPPKSPDLKGEPARVARDQCAASVRVEAALLEAPPALLRAVREAVAAGTAHYALYALEERLRIAQNLPNEIVQAQHDLRALPSQATTLKPGDMLQFELPQLARGVPYRELHVRRRPEWASRPGQYNVYVREGGKDSPGSNTTDAVNLEEALERAQEILKTITARAEHVHRKLHTSEAVEEMENDLKDLRRASSKMKSSGFNGAAGDADEYVEYTVPVDFEGSRYESILDKSRLPETLRVRVAPTVGNDLHGSWDGDTITVHLGSMPSSSAEVEQILAARAGTIEHEVTHATQTLLGLGRGLRYTEPPSRLETEGSERDKPAGLPAAITPYLRADEEKRAHPVRDIEFYSNLVSELHSFFSNHERARRWRTTIQDDAKTWIEMSPRFRAVKSYDQSRWEKMVTEFLRAVDERSGSPAVDRLTEREPNRIIDRQERRELIREEDTRNSAAISNSVVESLLRGAYTFNRRHLAEDYPTWQAWVQGQDAEDLALIVENESGLARTLNSLPRNSDDDAPNMTALIERYKSGRAAVLRIEAAKPGGGALPPGFDGFDADDVFGEGASAGPSKLDDGRIRELKVGDELRIDGKGPTWVVEKVYGAGGFVRREDAKRKWFGYSHSIDDDRILIYPVMQGSGDRTGPDIADGKPAFTSARGATVRVTAVTGKSEKEPWELTFKEYITALGGNKTHPSDSYEGHHAEPFWERPSTLIDTMMLSDGRKVEIRRSDVGEKYADGSLKHEKSIYAVLDGWAVGQVQDEWGATLVMVDPEFRGENIGARLTFHSRREWPARGSGGMTPQGYAMNRRVHKMFVADALARGVDVSPEVLADYAGLQPQAQSPHTPASGEPVEWKAPPSGSTGGMKPRDAMDSWERRDTEPGHWPYIRDIERAHKYPEPMRDVWTAMGKPLETSVRENAYGPGRPGYEYHWPKGQPTYQETLDFLHSKDLRPDKYNQYRWRLPQLGPEAPVRPMPVERPDDAKTAAFGHTAQTTDVECRRLTREQGSWNRAVSQNSALVESGHVVAALELEAHSMVLPPRERALAEVLSANGLSYPPDFTAVDAAYGRWKQQYAKYRERPKPVYEGGELDAVNRALSLSGTKRVSGLLESWELLTRGATRWTDPVIAHAISVLQDVPGLESLHLPEFVLERQMEDAEQAHWYSLEDEEHVAAVRVSAAHPVVDRQNVKDYGGQNDNVHVRADGGRGASAPGLCGVACWNGTPDVRRSPEITARRSFRLGWGGDGRTSPSSRRASHRFFAGAKPNLRSVRVVNMERALKRAGFLHSYNKGDHRFYKHPDGRLTQIDTGVDPISKRDIGNIRRQTGWSALQMSNALEGKIAFAAVRVGFNITAGRLDDVKAKYPNAAVGLVDQLAAGDPSGQNKYLAWMADQVVAKGQIAADVILLAQRFHVQQGRLPAESRDINKLDVDDLEWALGRAEMRTTNKEQDQQVIEGRDVIARTPEFTVYKIKNKAASCALGRNTKWCITERDKTHFEDYVKDGAVFYFVIQKDGTKHAVATGHSASLEVYDARDSLVSPLELPKGSLEVIYRAVGYTPETGARRTQTAQDFLERAEPHLIDFEELIDDPHTDPTVLDRALAYERQQHSGGLPNEMLMQLVTRPTLTRIQQKLIAEASTEEVLEYAVQRSDFSSDIILSNILPRAPTKVVEAVFSNPALDQAQILTQLVRVGQPPEYIIATMRAARKISPEAWRWFFQPGREPFLNYVDRLLQMASEPPPDVKKALLDEYVDNTPSGVPVLSTDLDGMKGGSLPREHAQAWAAESRRHSKHVTQSSEVTSDEALQMILLAYAKNPHVDELLRGFFYRPDVTTGQLETLDQELHPELIRRTLLATGEDLESPDSIDYALRVQPKSFMLLTQIARNKNLSPAQVETLWTSIKGATQDSAAYNALSRLLTYNTNNISEKVLRDIYKSSPEAILRGKPELLPDKTLTDVLRSSNARQLLQVANVELGRRNNPKEADENRKILRIYPEVPEIDDDGDVQGKVHVFFDDGISANFDVEGQWFKLHADEPQHWEWTDTEDSNLPLWLEDYDSRIAKVQKAAVDAALNTWGELITIERENYEQMHTDEADTEEAEVRDLQRGAARVRVTAASLWFHGSPNKFDAFKTGTKAVTSAQAAEVPVFFTQNKELARAHAGPQGFLYAVDLTPGKIFDVDNLAGPSKYWPPAEADLTPLGQSLLADLKAGRIWPSLQENKLDDDAHWAAYNDSYGTWPCILRGNWDELESNEMKSWIRAHGFDSFRVNGEDKSALALFDPSRAKILSVEPAHTDTPKAGARRTAVVRVSEDWRQQLKDLHQRDQAGRNAYVAYLQRYDDWREAAQAFARDHNVPKDDLFGDVEIHREAQPIIKAHIDEIATDPVMLETTWLLVQHMDKDVAFQRWFEPYLMKHGRNESSKQLMTDRILINRGLPQKHNTQRTAAVRVTAAQVDAEELAHHFHDVYEKLAPYYSYATKRRSRVEWSQVPQDNRQLMIATAGEVLRWLDQRGLLKHASTVEKLDHMMRRLGLKREKDVPGEAAGVFIRIPEHIAKDFPPKEEDASDPHLTVLYIGGPDKLPPEELKQRIEAGDVIDYGENKCGWSSAVGKRLAKAVAGVAAKHAPFELRLKPGVDFFSSTNEAQNEIAHKSVEPASHARLAALNADLRAAVEAVGVKPKHYAGDGYKSHATLAYKERGDRTYDGLVPEGSFPVIKLELWGWPVDMEFDLIGETVTRAAVRVTAQADVVGKVIEVPAGSPIFHNKEPARFIVREVRGDKVKVTPDYSEHYGAWMPLVSLAHFESDLNGRVPEGMTATSGHPAVDAVIRGEGEVLGKGDDGVAFRVGDQVVKMSTTVPYQPMNPGHRSPTEAAKMLAAQSDTAAKLRQAGVPGIMVPETVQHEGKAFQVRPFVEIPERLTSEELDSVQSAIDTMHQAGYALRDDIQVGRHPDGALAFYDIGKAAPIESHDAHFGERGSDLSSLVQLYRKHKTPWVPKGSFFEDAWKGLVRSIAMVDVSDAPRYQAILDHARTLNKPAAEIKIVETALARSPPPRKGAVRVTAGAQRLVHYSTMPGLKMLDPSYIGANQLSRNERQDMRVPVTFFYFHGTEPETLLTSTARTRYAAELPAGAKLLDLANAPLTVHEGRKRDGRGGMYNAIKDLGYFGFYNTQSNLPNAVAVFYPVSVTETSVLEERTASVTVWKQAFSDAETEEMIVAPFETVTDIQADSTTRSAGTSALRIVTKAPA